MRRVPALSFAVMLLVGTDTFLVAPLLPALSARFAVPPARAGWMVSAYAVGYCLTALVAGPVSDRLDRRRVLVAGMAAFSVATAATGLAWSFTSMLGLRLAAGVAAAVASPQIWATIAQVMPRERVVPAMATATAGLTIAQLLGVPAGSLLAVRSTSDPFVVVGAGGALVTVALWRWFPAVPPHGGTARVGLLAQYAALARTPRALGRFGAYLVFQVGNFAVLSFAATWFARDFHLDQAGIARAMIVLGAGNTVGALIGPRVVRRAGQGRALLGGSVCYLLIYAVVAASPTRWVGVALLAGAFTVGGVLFPVMMNLLQALTTSARGTVSALASVLMYAGSTLAGIVGGPLLAALPSFWGVSLLALATTSGALGLWAASGCLRAEPGAGGRG